MSRRAARQVAAPTAPAPATPGSAVTWTPAASDVMEVSAALRDLRPRAAPAGVPTARSSPEVDAPRARELSPVPVDVPGLDPTPPAGASAFSPDGRYWWDGARWQGIESSEADLPVGRRGRAVSVTAVATTVATLLALVVLAAFALPAYLVQRADAFQRSAQEALLDAHAAQETFRAQHRRYATDPAELASVGMPVPASLGVEVLATTDVSFCLGAALPGQGPQWFMTESGMLTAVACA